MKTQDPKIYLVALLIIVCSVVVGDQSVWAQLLPSSCDAPKPTTSPACTQNPGPTTCSTTQGSCGKWTNPVSICTESSPTCTGVHAAVLSTGNVLFWYKTGTNNQTDNSFVLPSPSSCPPTCSLSNVSPDPNQFTYDIECAGMSAGTGNVNGVQTVGTMIATGGIIDNTVDGINNTDFFTPATSSPFGSWSAGPTMSHKRFYPSNVQRPDATTLTIGGNDENGNPVTAMEDYTPSTNTWSGVGPTVPSSTSLYPRLKLMPKPPSHTSPLYVMAGTDNNTTTWDGVSTDLWQNAGKMTSEFSRNEGGVVILPGTGNQPGNCNLTDGTCALTQLLTAGGNTGQNGTGTSEDTSEIYTVSNAVWAIVTNQCMCFARYNLNLVLLADGSVLAMGGGNGTSGHYAGPIPVPELYNPEAQTWRPLKADPNGVNRTYHSTALLLPDGRVLASGSDTTSPPTGNNPNTFEIFTPPYLVAADDSPLTRPSISSLSVTSNITYNSSFIINTPDFASISKVTLIRPGATTHANDFEQRVLKLTFSVTTTGCSAGFSSCLSVTTPLNTSYAPPGYYMLFIVNSSGVPSLSWIFPAGKLLLLQ